MVAGNLQDIRKLITRVEMKIDDLQEDIKNCTVQKEKKLLQKELKETQNDPKYQQALKDVVELEAAEKQNALKEQVTKKADTKPAGLSVTMNQKAAPKVVATPESVMALLDSTLAAGDKNPQPARDLKVASQGLGEDAVRKLNLGQTIDEALAGKDANTKIGALRALKALAWFPLIAVPRAATCIKMFGDAKAAKAAVDTVSCIVKEATPESLPTLVIPSIILAVEDKKKWKVKAAALEVLAAVTETMVAVPKQLAGVLAKMIPICIESSREIRAEIRDGALNVLNSVGRAIVNPEIKALNEQVIAALADPTNQKLTQDVLMDLGSTTFMNYVDANALAILVPILVRALREREQKSKKWAAQILGSCVKLVKEVDYLVPYLPELLPLLKKALVDTAPEVQREAAKSFAQISIALPEVYTSDIAPYLKTLLSSTEENERTGVANAISHIHFVAGKESLPTLLNEAYAESKSTDPKVRHSYFEVLDIVPALFKEEYAQHIFQTLSAVLGGCADTDEMALEAAMRGATSLIEFFGALCPDVLFPALRDSYLLAEDPTVRKRMVEHIVHLTTKIMDHKKYGQDLLTTEIGSREMREKLLVLLFLIAKGDEDAVSLRTGANGYKIACGAPKNLKEALGQFQSFFAALRETGKKHLAGRVDKTADGLVAAKAATAEEATGEADVEAILKEVTYVVKGKKWALGGGSDASDAGEEHDINKAVEHAKDLVSKALVSADEAVRSFAEALAVSALVEGHSRRKARARLAEVLAPLVTLEDSVLDSLAEAMHPHADEEDADGGEELFRVDNMMLMYGGGKLLLKDTTLRMCRARRYGVVGHNGAGKTTLMKQLAAGNVANMPKDIQCVHVSDAELGDLKVLEMNAVEFVKADAPEGVDIDQALEDVNYPKDMQDKLVSDLSGGWRMRLILARAMMKNADVLLLDEPTNHLDVQAIAWLEEYLQKQQTGTMMIISHEKSFLNKVCTDIMQYKDQKLNFYRGNFDEFQRQIGLTEEDTAAYLKGDLNLDEDAEEQGDEVQMTTLTQKAQMRFPIPGKLPGIASSAKAVMSMKDVNFTYDPEKPMILNDVTCKVTLGSRIAVVGRNGAGKSTLMGLLCREINPTEVDGKVGEVWRHHNLRLAYIAQHHMETLGKFYKSTPYQYLQHRYQNGYDEELQKHLLDPKDEEEALFRKELGKKHGKYGLSVGAVVGRSQKGKTLLYEVQWEGLSDAKQNTYETLDTLRKLGVEKFATACDARIQASQMGADQRMVSRREAIKHLEQFGIDEEMCCNREIGSFSAGQKSKLALGAAFWTKPHVVCLDEPTNYLDPETVGALARALKWFRGGVLVITHHQGFIDEVCNEAWNVGGGQCVIKALENDNKRMA